MQLILLLKIREGAGEIKWKYDYFTNKEIHIQLHNQMQQKQCGCTEVSDSFLFGRSLSCQGVKELLGTTAVLLNSACSFISFQ